MQAALAHPWAKPGALLLLFAFLAAAISGCFRTATYHDCILRYMPGTGDRGAAQMIEDACHRQYGRPPS